MRQIDISQWKEFPLSQMFDICYGKFIPKKDRGTKTPMITTTADNNGISYYVDSDPLFAGDALTVASDGSVGSTFYQDKDFSAGNIVVVLEPKKSTKQNWSPRSAQFLATCIKRYALIKYGWANKYSVNRVRNTKLPLPVDKNGDPNWQYMDTYIAKLTTLAHKNVSSLKKTKAKPTKFNIDQWGEFKASDLFNFDHGKRLTKKDRIPGKIPFCTAGAENQGIVDHLNGDFVIWHKPITIDMFGNTFYHNFDCAGDDNIYALINNDLPKTSKIFITSVLNRQLKQKYSFKDQFRQSDLDHLIIKLPIDANGEPDWEYMDNQVCHFATLSNLTITSLDPVKLPIFVGEWKEFKINKLFTIQTGTDLIMRNLENGKYPLVTHSQENNGITKYISKLQNRQLYDHTRTLSVADRGTFFVAHQTSDFHIGTRVKVLIYKGFIPINDNIALFLATSINKLRDRFYNYAENATNRLPDSLIRLPVNFNGDPDWQYMDQYISWIKQYSKNKLTLIQ